MKLILPTLLVALSALGQSGETVNVHVIEVPVTVADRAGNPVRGLTAANFEILDGGVRRAVTGFEVVDFAERGSADVAPKPNRAARRTFLLLFDLGFSSPNSLQRAKDAARSFVQQSVAAGDLVAVATIDVDKGFRLLSTFTTDRELIAAAIADPFAFHGSDPLGLANETRIIELIEPDDSKHMVVPTFGNNGNAMAADRAQREMQEQIAAAQIPSARRRAEREIEALQGLARGLRVVPGRKQIVFLSEGFDPKLLQGRDAREQDDQQKENASVIRGQVWDVDSDKRYGSSASMSMLERMTVAFQRSDVVLHAIDIQGIRVQNDLTNGSRVNSNAGLALLARPSGGDVLQNANDLRTGFDRLLRAQEVVYVLAFQAPSLAPGAFHELSVKLAGAPRGARASFRSGYYESGGESGAERMLSAAAIVMNDVAQPGVRVAALVAPIPGNPRVPVILELSGADLASGVQTEQATAEIFLYAFDEQGIVRDRSYQTITFDLAKVGDRLRSGGLKVYSTLELRAGGRYAIKTLVRVRETDRKGFARADVDVPAAGAMAVLPPLFLDEPGRALLARAARGESSPFPFHINGEPFMPRALASVKRGGFARFVVFVYNLPAADVVLDAAAVDDDGRRAAVSPTLVGEVRGDGVTKLVYDLPAAGLDARVARLEVTVHGKGSAEARTSVPLLMER
jgi:VWFA-related protein